MTAILYRVNEASVPYIPARRGIMWKWRRTISAPMDVKCQKWGEAYIKLKENGITEARS